MDDQLATSIGIAARKARLALGLTQEDTAERLRVTPEFYARIERGQALPSVPSFTRICATLRVTADSLLGRTQEPTPLAPVQLHLFPRPASDLRRVRRLIRRLRRASSTTVQMVTLLVQELYKRPCSWPSA